MYLGELQLNSGGGVGREVVEGWHGAGVGEAVVEGAVWWELEVINFLQRRSSQPSPPSLVSPSAIQ